MLGVKETGDSRILDRYISLTFGFMSSVSSSVTWLHKIRPPTCLLVVNTGSYHTKRPSLLLGFPCLSGAFRLIGVFRTAFLQMVQRAPLKTLSGPLKIQGWRDSQRIFGLRRSLIDEIINSPLRLRQNGMCQTFGKHIELYITQGNWKLYMGPKFGQCNVLKVLGKTAIFSWNRLPSSLNKGEIKKSVLLP